MAVTDFKSSLMIAMSACVAILLTQNAGVLFYIGILGGLFLALAAVASPWHGLLALFPLGICAAPRAAIRRYPRVNICRTHGNGVCQHLYQTSSYPKHKIHFSFLCLATFDRHWVTVPQLIDCDETSCPCKIGSGALHPFIYICAHARMRTYQR